MVEDFFIQLFALLAVVGPLALLFFLNRIPRWWRLGLWFFCTVMLLFSAYFLSAMVSYFRMMNFGHHTVDFLVELQKQLTAGSVREELLEVPGYAAGIILTALAMIAVIAGGVFAWRKIHGYSYFILIFAFLCIPFAFSAPHKSSHRQDVLESNAFRSQIYTLISQKRAQNVTGKQMADAIKKALEGFKFPCRREDVDQLMKRVKKALDMLTPPEAAGAVGQGKK